MLKRIENRQCFGPHVVWGENPQIPQMAHSEHVAKFGWLAFGDLRVLYMSSLNYQN